MKPAMFCRALVLLLALAVPAGARSIFGSDDRLPVDTDGEAGAAFRPIGIVRPAVARGGFSSASGFLVSPCLILTAYHAVYGDTPLFVKPPRTWVNFSLRVRGAWRGYHAVPVACGSYRCPGEADWALLRIDQAPCPGADPSIGWLGLDAAEPQALIGAKLGTAAYYGDAKGRMLADPDCTVRAIRDDTLLHDCAGLPGASGAPIYRSAEGRLVVVALQSGGTAETAEILPYSAAKANVATSIAEILRDAQVRAIIERDRAGAPAS